jgi:single-stranded DNA-binding protein|nr:MAG TPA: Single strand binding protein [Caudoviricetes sp.]
MAETTHEYCQKGDILGIEYIVKNYNWKDNKGNKHYDYTFMANRMSFLQTKTNNQQEPKQAENVKKSTDEQIYADFGDSIEISDDDIAF